MKTTKIIKKVLEELNQEKPRLDYIRGLLEGLVENDDLVTDIERHKAYENVPVKTEINSSLDEGSVMDNFAKSNLATVKRLSEESQ